MARIAIADAISADMRMPEPGEYGRRYEDAWSPDLAHAARVERLRAALQEALGLIESFHGAPGWGEYQASPEMRRLRAALACRDV